jgi:predicted RNase H-like HicB family nuclease
MDSQILKYAVIIYWSTDDDAFVAEVPELPGCAAEGSTPHDALSNVHRIAEEWIQTARELGREIPAPHGRLLYA